MRFLQLCVWCFLALLSACGGGGGSPGVPAGSASPSNFIVNAPAELTLPVGQAVTYSINGGKSPYIATTSVPDVAKVLINGSELLIAALKTGTTSAVIAPTGGGASYTIAITVVDNFQPLQIQSPDTLNLIPGNVVDYPITGGVPPYRATVSNGNIAAVSVLQNNTLRVEARVIGNTTIQVFDAVNNKAEKAVTVLGSIGPDLFTTAPSDLTLPPAITRTFSVSGGLPPYQASSSNESVMTANVIGNTLTVTSRTEGTAAILVKDAAGKFISIAGTVSLGAVVPLFTTAPASLTLVPSAGSREFTIGGGRAPYVAESSNSSVVNAVASGTTLRLTPINDGNATVTIKDALGGSLPLTITVSSGPVVTLSTTAPATLTMGPGDAGKRTFSIFGGTKPYKVESSNLLALEAVLSANGTDFTLKAPDRATGSATVRISDAAGAERTINVTISASTIPLSLSASDVQTFVNLEVRVRIIGGAPPYTAVSSIPDAMSVRLDGQDLVVTPKLVSSGLEATVIDSAGQKVAVKVTTSNGTPGIRIAPVSMTISENAVGQTFDLEVIGASAGAFRVFSSDIRRINVRQIDASTKIRITTSSDPAVLAVDATTDVTVTVIDSRDQLATMTVKIEDNKASTTTPVASLLTTAPSAVTLQTGSNATFTIVGGLTPYSVATSNQAVVTVSNNGNQFTINGAGNGTASVVVSDARGTTATPIAVTVSSSSVAAPLFTTASPTVTLTAGTASATFTIGGGVAPYTVTSSNTALVTVAQSGNTFTMSRVAAGGATTTNVVVKDAAGTTVTIVVTTQ